MACKWTPQHSPNKTPKGKKTWFLTFAKLTQELMRVLAVHVKVGQRAPVRHIIAAYVWHRVAPALNLVEIPTLVIVMETLVPNRQTLVRAHHLRDATIHGDRLTNRVSEITELVRDRSHVSTSHKLSPGPRIPQVRTSHTAEGKGNLILKAQFNF